MFIATNQRFGVSDREPGLSSSGCRVVVCGDSSVGSYGCSRHFHGAGAVRVVPVFRVDSRLLVTTSSRANLTSRMVDWAYFVLYMKVPYYAVLPSYTKWLEISQVCVLRQGAQWLARGQDEQLAAACPQVSCPACGPRQE